MNYQNKLKLKLKLALTAFVAASTMLPPQVQAGDRDRGGGNETGILFSSLTKEISLDLLKLEHEGTLSALSGFNGVTLANEWLNQKQISVFMTNQDLYSDEKTKKHVVTGLSSPSKRTILINEKRFNSIPTLEQRKSWVLHEMLVIEKLETTGDYHISSTYLHAIQSTNLKDLPSITPSSVNQKLTLAGAVQAEKSDGASFSAISQTLSSSKESKLFEAAHSNLKSQFDNRCGDTFCEGDYSYQSLGLDCTYNNKTKMVKECVWTFAGSLTDVSDAGNIKQKSKIFTCHLPIKKQSIEQTLTFFANASLDSHKLPNADYDIWDILMSCLE